MVLVSQTLVLVMGITIIVLAGWGVFAPGKLMTFVTSVMDQRSGIYIAVVVRLLLGVALIIVAPASLFPVTFQVLGWVTIFAAVALAVAGRDRLRRFIAWLSERLSESVVRMWLLFGVAFAAFLVYGVL